MGPLFAGPTFIGDRRVPLHPGDAAKFRREHNDALNADDQRRSQAMAAESVRLAAIAERKKRYDRMQRQQGEVDQQLSYDMAAEDFGIQPIQKPQRSFSVWATSEPESRNILAHLLQIPENAVYQVSEALSGEKPRQEIAQRLGAAIPGAFYPPAGFPVEPGRDRMYEELGPVGGLVAEMAMPGLDVAAAERLGSVTARRARNLYGAADSAWRTPVRSELVDLSGDVIRRLRNAQ